jgi:hypothetical protein
MDEQLWRERLRQVIDKISVSGQVSDGSRANLVWLVDAVCADFARRNGFRREAKFIETHFVLKAADYRGSVWIGSFEHQAKAILGLDARDRLTLYNPDGGGILEREFERTIVEHWAAGGGGAAFQYSETFKPHIRRLALPRIDLGRIVTHDGDRKPAAALGFIVLDSVTRKGPSPLQKAQEQLPLLPLWDGSGPQA